MTELKQKSQIDNRRFIQCSVFIPKLINNFYVDCQCKKPAKFEVFYKISKRRNAIISKKCCTVHKTKLLKEIEKYPFAELHSIIDLKQTDACAVLD